jgi:hypothetical protein
LAAVWQEGNGSQDGVNVTLRPAYYWLEGVQDCEYCTEHLAECLPCRRADVNGDCAVNGLDIRPFVKILLGDFSQEDIRLDTGNFCRADMQQDGDVDVDDIPCFIQALLTGDGSCQVSEAPRGIIDCDANEVDDANDIGWGDSADCNQNGIPDTCDIADETSLDENENSIPDSCEPDCNANGHPDDLDIVAASEDVNSNGIPDECEKDCNENDVPDEWDISEESSADCNLNGVPDECEVAISDCNSNGVPDDCDTDITDPDGDEWVSADCNGNKYPDECDLTLTPPFGSLDCNENDIPDECDIADETSTDTNENGIPDECEEEERGGPMGDRLLVGSTQDTGEEDPTLTLPLARGGNAVPEAERWASFYDWCVTADLRGLSQRQRYDAIMAELEAQNLPKAWPPIPIAP